MEKLLSVVNVERLVEQVRAAEARQAAANVQLDVERANWVAFMLTLKKKLEHGVKIFDTSRELAIVIADDISRLLGKEFKLDLPPTEKKSSKSVLLHVTKGKKKN